MKRSLLIFFLIILVGCSQNKITWKHRLFLAKIEQCFVAENTRVDNKQRVLDFLAGNFDYDGYALSITNKYAEIIDFVHIVRKINRNGDSIFKVDKDRQFIAPWMSDCEGLAEFWINPKSMELKR
jgi:hypothetical protein